MDNFFDYTRLFRLVFNFPTISYFLPIIGISFRHPLLRQVGFILYLFLLLGNDVVDFPFDHVFHLGLFGYDLNNVYFLLYFFNL